MQIVGMDTNELSLIKVCFYASGCEERRSCTRKGISKTETALRKLWCIYQKHTAAKTTFDYTVQQHA